MSAVKLKTTDVPRYHSQDYQKKAEEFLSVMRMCMEDRQWDAAVLNGVHACISITDALLVYKEEIRCISERHEDVVTLLKQTISAKLRDGQDARLSRILGYKHLVSYLPIKLDVGKATEFAKSVERYFDWARKMLA